MIFPFFVSIGACFVSAAHVRRHANFGKTSSFIQTTLDAPVPDPPKNTDPTPANTDPTPAQVRVLNTNFSWTVRS
jgi:hypothetical protein